MQRYNLFPVLLCTTIRLFTLLLLSIRHLHHKITIKLIKKSFLSQTWAKGGSINFHLKTSDFFGQKYGGFASKVRRFYAKKSDVSVLPKDEIQRTHSPPTKIFFVEISYISYTRTTNLLYLLAISGEGLGVGFLPRCRVILHLPPFSTPFPPYFRLGNVPEPCSSVPNAGKKCTKTC